MLNKNITGVITGDIVESRLHANTTWLPKLKKVLSKAGRTSRAWEVYRGDSFQVEIKKPAHAFLTVIQIKSAIKTVKDLDVRMSIGIGTKKQTARKVTESDGEAFIFSGETFETLKKSKRNLAIRTPWPEFDRDMNLYFQLASIPMDEWTQGSAEFVELLLGNRKLTQSALAKKLGVTQPAISDRGNRAHYETLMELEALFREKISALIASK